MKINLLLYLLMLPGMLNAAIGCMDNSYHADGREDYKTYHYVSCPCACRNLIDERGFECDKCTHKGWPTRGVVNNVQRLGGVAFE